MLDAPFLQSCEQNFCLIWSNVVVADSDINVKIFQCLEKFIIGKDGSISSDSYLVNITYTPPLNYGDTSRVSLNPSTRMVLRLVSAEF